MRLVSEPYLVILRPDGSNGSTRDQQQLQILEGQHHHHRNLTLLQFAGTSGERHELPFGGSRLEGWFGGAKAVEGTTRPHQGPAAAAFCFSHRGEKADARLARGVDRGRSSDGTPPSSQLEGRRWRATLERDDLTLNRLGIPVGLGL